MKKSLLVVIVSVLVLATTILWQVNPMVHTIWEYMQFFIIGVLVCFGLYVGYRRFTSERRGQPAEDEFSKKVLQKTAALSYYVSLYLWLVVMYLSGRYKLETEVLIGGGILGMAVVFAAAWIFFNFRGVKDA
jgi:peptidoglycan/LPS O-acetylase OafA/YrhL